MSNQVNISYHSPIKSDGGIIAAFDRIAESLGQALDQCNVNISPINRSSHNLQNEPLSNIRKRSLVKHAKQFEGVTWSNINISYLSINMSLSIVRNYEEGIDTINIYFTPEPKNPVELRRSIIAVQEQFRPRYIADSLEEILGPEVAEFYRIREDNLSRLESLNERITKECHNYRIKLDDEVSKRKESLSMEFESMKKDLELDYESRRKQIEARRIKLDALRKELDDRSARHARRELSKKLHQTISRRSSEFNLTEDTQKKRLPIHAIFISLLVVSLVGSSLTWIFGNPTELWTQVKIIIGAIGFSLAAIFYIRWNDDWFRQHADQEFRLKQLALDIDRGGYAVELLLEWQEQKGSAMPDAIIDRLTTGLFTNQPSDSNVKHPSEDIASRLIKLASSVRLNLPGVGEVDVTGRQIRKLAKSETALRKESK